MLIKPSNLKYHVMMARYFFNCFFLRIRQITEMQRCTKEFERRWYARKYWLLLWHSKIEGVSTKSTCENNGKWFSMYLYQNEQSKYFFFKAHFPIKWVVFGNKQLEPWNGKFIRWKLIYIFLPLLFRFMDGYLNLMMATDI